MRVYLRGFCTFMPRQDLNVKEARVLVSGNDFMVLSPINVHPPWEASWVKQWASSWKILMPSGVTPKLNRFL